MKRKVNERGEKFAKWLNSQMERRRMSQADLARASGLKTATISIYCQGKSTNPDPKALSALARGLELPDEEVYMEAGIMPKKPEKPASFEELEYWFSRMTPDEQEDFIEYGRLRVEIQRRKEQDREQSNNGGTTASPPEVVDRTR